MPFVHPEFEMTTPADMASEPDTYRGPDGVRRYFESWYEVMESVRVEPDEFIEVGERVVVPFTVYARGKATGIEMGQPAVQVWELHGEQVIRLNLFAELDEAMSFARAGGN